MTVSIGDVAQMVSCIALVVTSVYALRAYKRLEATGLRYANALIELQGDADEALARVRARLNDLNGQVVLAIVRQHTHGKGCEDACHACVLADAIRAISSTAREESST